MTLRGNSIAAGHNNVAGLINIEAIIVDNVPFFPVQDWGNYAVGQEFIRGTAGLGFTGSASTSWTYPNGGITIQQYYYIYNTLLSTSFTGNVTIRTTLINPASYVNCNAVLNLRQMPEYFPLEGGWLRGFQWDFVNVEVIV